MFCFDFFLEAFPRLQQLLLLLSGFCILVCKGPGSHPEIQEQSDIYMPECEAVAREAHIHHFFFFPLLFCLLFSLFPSQYCVTPEAGAELWQWCYVYAH